MRCQRAVGWELRDLGVTTHSAPWNPGTLQKMLLFSKPQFSAAIMWGQTGKIWIHNSPPGVHISHGKSCFQAPGARPSPSPTESE